VFSRREKVFMVLAALAVGLALAFQLAGTSPGPSRVEQARIGRRLRDARNRVNALEARLAKMTDPASKAVPGLLHAAQASGASTGVTIASVRPRRPTKTESGCQENSLEIQATGIFPNVIKFMVDIRQKNPYVRLARVTMNSTDAASDKVTSTVVLSSYSQPEVSK